MNPFVLSGSRTYNQTGAGLYTLATVTFGGPSDWFKIAPGRQTKGGLVNMSITRGREKDITIGGLSQRSRLLLIKQFQVEQGWTSAEMDACASDMSEFLTPERIDYFMLGGS